MTWDKHGGHAGGKKIDEVVAAARVAGFVPAERTSMNTPDGSVIGSGGGYLWFGPHHEMYILRTCRSFGATAADNYFSLQLSGPAPAKKGSK
jgi:hypothetical protein